MMTDKQESETLYCPGTAPGISRPPIALPWKSTGGTEPCQQWCKADYAHKTMEQNKPISRNFDPYHSQTLAHVVMGHRIAHGS